MSSPPSEQREREQGSSVVRQLAILALRAFRASAGMTAIAFALFLATPTLAGPNFSTASAPQEDHPFSFAPIVKKVSPAVVNIFAKRVVRESASPLLNDPVFRQFFGNNPLPGPVRERVERSLGSGVIIGEEGLIVTSNHVVKDAEEISVVLADRREFAATVTKRDPQSDLAFLHIDAKGLPVLPMRDSDTLEVGDVALAIGNPFGIGQTVTHGIISALSRPAQGVSDYQFFIQTDAPINPGNSGGALVDARGSLIGINTAIYSAAGGSNGIGFAIPANMVKAVEAGKVEGGKFVRPWFGLSVQEVTQEMAESMGLKTPHGALVSKVAPGGPAAKAGLREGDLITAVGDADVADGHNLIFRLATLPIGGSTELTFTRKGASMKTTLTAEAPRKVQVDTLTLKGRQPLAGLVVATITPELAEELGVEGMQSGGVVVVGGEGKLALQKGDVIVEVNGQTIKTAAQLEQVLVAAKKRRWTIGLQRGNNTIKFNVQM